MFKTLMYRIAFLFTICILPLWNAKADVVLWSEGTTNFDIIVGKEASPSEHTAARELSVYLEKVSGLKYPIREVTAHEDVEGDEILRQSVKKHLCVGYISCSMIHKGCSHYSADDESFEIVEYDGNILINGGQKRGTLYAVYTLLEDQVGIHWYTPSYTHIPSRTSCSLRDTGYNSPCVPYRFDYGYDALRNDEWCAHNRLNMQTSPRTNQFGGMEGYWGIHTFQKLLPAEEYFHQHPEYFSMREGRRIDDGQLCLSNSHVLDIVTRRLLQVIKDNPDCWGYDVSQNDNKLYCECNQCAAIAKRYGGQSGLMLWFVNQVAERVYRLYPDRLVGTFAYQYTRQAPRGIRPAHNVLIRLCDIECCRIHGLEECEVNLRFDRDMKQWKTITERIFVWDYITDFRSYQIPYPVFRHLGSNIEYFCRNHVLGVLEQGAHDAPWAEFSELKQWLVARLLWQPNQDVDSLAHMFIRDYYGIAADAIWQYCQMVEALCDTNIHANCHAVPNASLYTCDFRNESRKQLERAESLALSAERDGEVVRRVRRVLCQAYIMHVQFDLSASVTDGTLSKLKTIISDDPTFMAEFKEPLDRYLQRIVPI